MAANAKLSNAKRAKGIAPEPVWGQVLPWVCTVALAGCALGWLWQFKPMVMLLQALL
jgi:hypothetical protein